MESIFAHFQSAKKYISQGIAISGGNSAGTISGLAPTPTIPDRGPNSDLPHYNFEQGWSEPRPLSADNSYTIVTRSFAPHSSFGGGFEGNDRGYSTDIDASSKVTQEVGIDLDEDQAITSFEEHSDQTTHHLVPEQIYSPTENPDGGLLHQNVIQDGDKTILQFGTEIDAENPFSVIPGTDLNPAPSIDVFTEYELVQDKENNTLNITGTITGDDFPATEALIYDSNGQPLFLGVGAPPEFASPLTTLIGENDRPITDFDIVVNTDSHGNFESVVSDGKEYSIEDWNESFTSQEVDFVDPLTDPVNGGLEEINEAAGEISDEVSEAQTEISEADGFIDTTGEIIEGGVEIGGEIIEGIQESGQAFEDGFNDTKDAIIDKIFGD